MKDRYLGVDRPDESHAAAEPTAALGPQDEATRERQACLAVCRRVLVEGPVPHSLHAAYDEIERQIQSAPARQEGRS